MITYNASNFHWCLIIDGWIEEFATKSEALERKHLLER